MGQRFYPRNRQGRRDAIAGPGHVFHGPRNDQERLAALSVDASQPYNSAGVLTNSGGVRTLYEGDLAQSGVTLALHIRNEAEKWAIDVSSADNGASQALLLGVGSIGITQDFNNIVRSSDKDLTLAFSPAPTFGDAVGAVVNVTVASPAFQYRSIASEAVPLFTVTPLSLSLGGNAGPGPILESEVVTGGKVVTFTIVNTEETWNSSLGGANSVSSAFIGGVSSANIPWVRSNVVRTSDKIATLTFPAAAGFSIAANFKLGITLPNSCFTKLGRSYAVNTMTVITNE